MPLDELIPGLIGLCLFGLPTLYGVWLAFHALRSDKWPSTKGTITTSQVRPSRRSQIGRRHQATVDIRYDYRVNGQQYSGSRVRFGGAIEALPAAAHTVIGRYPKGAQVDVYYASSRPSLSTLERRTSGWLWIWLGIGGFMTTSIGGSLAGWW